MTKRLLLVALLAVLVLSVVPPAQAVTGPFTSVWNTKALWDTGTKVNADTATNSCLASGNGIQLNATGGNYGVSFRCPTGVPKISSANQTLGLDFSTTTPNPLLSYADLSKEQFVAATTKTAQFQDGVHGGAVWISHNAGAVVVTGECTTAQCTTGWAGSYATAHVSFMVWVKPNYSADGAIHTILADAAQGNPAGYFWEYVPQNGRLSYQWSDTVGGTYSGTCGPNPFPQGNSWVAVVVRANYSRAAGGHLFNCNIGGIAYPNVNMTVGAGKVLASPPASRTLYLGNYGYSTTLGWGGEFDDFVILTRWASNNEASAFGTVGGYASFGSWTSPDMNVTNAYPTQVLLTWKNISSSARVEGYSIWNPDTGSEFDTINPWTSGSFNLSAVNITSAPSGAATWRIELDLSGDGAGTAQVQVLAVTFVSLPPAAPPQMTGVMWLLLIVALVCLALAFIQTPFAILSGLAFVALALAAYIQFADVILSGLTAGLGMLVMIAGIAGMRSHSGEEIVK